MILKSSGPRGTKFIREGGISGHISAADVPASSRMNSLPRGLGLQGNIEPSNPVRPEIEVQPSLASRNPAHSLPQAGDDLKLTEAPWDRIYSGRRYFRPYIGCGCTCLFANEFAPTRIRFARQHRPRKPRWRASLPNRAHKKGRPKSPFF